MDEHGTSSGWDEPHAPGRSRRVPRVVLTLATAAGLAAGGFAVASAASPSPASPSPTAAAPGSPTAPTPPAPGTSGAPTPPAGPEGGPGRRPGSGPGREAHGRGGLVTAVSATSITVRPGFGQPVTWTINGDTKVREGSEDVAVSTIAVGQRVEIRGDATASPRVAKAVVVVQPHLAGTVTGVSGSTITIRDLDGFTRTITTSGSTTYTKDGATGTLAAVTTGVRVGATGRVDGDGTTLDATRVNVLTKAPVDRPGGPGPGGHGRGGHGPGGRGPGAVPQGTATPSPAAAITS